MKKHSQQSGIIEAIILIIIALIILGYFNISIKSIINAPTVQQNLQYAWNLVVWGWNYAWTTILQFIHQYFPNAKI